MVGRGVRLRHVAFVALIAAGLTWVALRWWAAAGRALPEASWISLLVLVFMAAAVVGAAWPVRRMVLGRTPSAMSPLRAARVFVLTQTAALSGAVIAGAYAGSAVHFLADLDIASQRNRLWLALGCAVGGVLLSAAGLVGQWMCHLDPPDAPPDEPSPFPG